MKEPALLLLPNLLSEARYHEVFLPSSVDKAVGSIDGLIAESEQGARRYLSHFKMDKKPHEVPVALLNEHSHDEDLDFLLQPIAEGQRWGLVSDGGLPCIADPGSKLVARARKRGMLVQAFVGPCSFLLALMLSGLSGQKFFFHGYLDKEPIKRDRKIGQIEKSSRENHATQIFMEAPYRNRHLLDSLLHNLSTSTSLSVAWDLTMPSQGVVTHKIEVWRKVALPNIDKKPAVFLVQAF
ncbi:hypothetical protein PHSC3_001391 [Chlamydiales bacterium STE3]|nr:hypothetical protein PHSC3_001391 [Chlamydiales bacterium STE3]